VRILEAAATSKTAHCRIVTVTASGTVRIGYTAAVELPVYDTDCPKSFKLACTLEFKIAYRVTGTCQWEVTNLLVCPLRLAALLVVVVVVIVVGGVRTSAGVTLVRVNVTGPSHGTATPPAGAHWRTGTWQRAST
jgi:hypothetical protein